MSMRNDNDKKILFESAKGNQLKLESKAFKGSEQEIVQFLSVTNPYNCQIAKFWLFKDTDNKSIIEQAEKISDITDSTDKLEALKKLQQILADNDTVNSLEALLAMQLENEALPEDVIQQKIKAAKELIKQFDAQHESTKDKASFGTIKP
jgi:hypothetical protein